MIRAVGVLKRGRGQPLTLFVPGGDGEHLAQRMSYADGVKGTKLGFAYTHSGHFASVGHRRRGAERDAGEVCALIAEHHITRAIGFSRGAQAVVGALAEGPSPLERIALVIPPAGHSAGKWLPWLQSGPRDAGFTAEVLVVGHRGDQGHPARVARDWAEQLGARLELMDSRAVITDAERVADLLAEFFS